VLTSRRVVITGLGAIAPNGIGKDAFWASLIRGESAVGRITSFDPSRFRTHIAAEIRDLDPTDFVAPLRAGQMWRFAQFAVASALLAIRDAGIQPGSTTLSERTAICFGTSVAGAAGAEPLHTQFLRDRPTRRLLQFVTECPPHSAASHVAIELGITGPSLTVSTNCCTGLDVIGVAHAQVASGFSDIAVAGACEAPIAPMTLGAFSALNLLSTRNDAPALASRPYDRSRDGLVLGEGGGAVVLEELGSAVARGATIYAEIGSHASSNEASDMRETDVKGTRMAATARAAVSRAGLCGPDIDYINAHGSSLPDYDTCDTNAFKAAFGEHAYRIPISSIKSMIGQAIAASGLFQVISSCLSMRDNLLPPTINQVEPDPDCDLDYVPNRARPAVVSNVLINAHAIGGGLSALVLKRLRS
jgi:3-oxoacyl-[acyl-carrier-protein] synthase II